MTAGQHFLHLSGRLRSDPKRRSVLYHTRVARRSSSTSSLAQPPVRSSRPVAAQDAAVRRYLRAIVGAPVSSADTATGTEAAFLDAASSWARRSGADARCLLALGVPRRVVNQAALDPAAEAKCIQRHWKPAPFSVADLAGRTGLTQNATRHAIDRAVQAGLLTRVNRTGTAVYRPVR